MKIKWTLEKAKEEFTKKGLTLLEEEFKSVDTPMECIAKCGHKKRLSLYNLMVEKGLYCKECTHKLRAEKRKYSYEFVKEEFEKRNCFLISKSYDKWDSKLTYIASCGHINEITFNKFHSIKQGTLCNKCRFPKGENHHKWNKDISDDERILNRDYYAIIKWRIEVYERDKYTCQLCGDNKGGNLNAHHLNGYDKFIEERLLIENGITLCEKCHNGFHKIYGYGNNTKDQFIEYMTIPR